MTKCSVHLGPNLARPNPLSACPWAGCPWVKQGSSLPMARQCRPDQIRPWPVMRWSGAPSRARQRGSALVLRVARWKKLTRWLLHGDTTWAWGNNEGSMEEQLRAPMRWSASTAGSRRRSSQWQLDRGTTWGYWRWWDPCGGDDERCGWPW
jgi:hypothetical protein